MTKTEFITELMSRTGMTSARKAKDALDATLDIIGDALAKGERVQFVGFGTFSPVKKPPRIARNPKTGEQIKIPSKITVKFAPGSTLKNSIN